MVGEAAAHPPCPSLKGLDRKGCLTCGSGFRPGRQPTFPEPGAGTGVPMPTLQCTSCGATYQTAATARRARAAHIRLPVLRLPRACTSA